MTEPLLDPSNVPVEWHRFLYRSVLLEWETVLHQRKQFPRFNGRKPLAGINLVKMEGLPELRQWLSSQAETPKPSECFTFYSKETALKDFLNLFAIALLMAIIHLHAKVGFICITSIREN